jgi:cytochrome c
MKRPLLMNCLVACAFAAAMAITGATEAPVTTPVPGDPAHGKTLYQACQACHSIDDNDLGPKHRGVVGQREALPITTIRWL